MSAVRMWEGTGDLVAMRDWARGWGGEVFTAPDEPLARVVLITRFSDRAAAEAWDEGESPAVRSHAWVFDAD